MIHTTRNTVYAYDAQPDDVLIRIGWSAPSGDGKHLCPITLPYQPISGYQAAVEWAISMADQLAHPIHVLPLSHNDIFNTSRWTEFRDYIAGMNDQERGELRQIVVTTAAEVMRDCNDPDIRADMFDILAKLRVVQAA